MISRPLNQTLLHEPRTGAAAAARESVCILGPAERPGPKLNNMQDVELMDPECSGNGVHHLAMLRLALQTDDWC